jgi:cytokinin dehydrogenase
MHTHPSRRAFLDLAARVSGSLVVGFDSRLRRWVVEGQTKSKVFAEGPKLDGSLLYDEASRAAAATDFGNIVHRMPAAVLKPGSAQDVVTMVFYANEHAINIAMRGQGHSAYGQSMVKGGIVIDSSTLNQISITGNSVIAEAGTTWGDLAAATVARGLTPPVTLQDPTQTVTWVGHLGNQGNRYWS